MEPKQSRPSDQDLIRACAQLRQQNASLQVQLATAHEQLATANARIASLEQQVEKLQAELRQGKRQATPFSRGTRKKNPKKPGRKKGQGPFANRPEPPAQDTESVEVPLDCCPCCGGPLSELKLLTHTQTDLPKPTPIHTQFVNQSGWCEKCKKRFRSRHPEQTSNAAGAAGVSLGPRIIASATDLHCRQGVPYAKVAEHFAVTAGLRVTPSALAQACQRLAKKAQSVYDSLINLIRQATAIHADETGWRVGGQSAWLWVFTSEEITVYVVDKTRSHAVVVRIVGEEFWGTLVSDCYLAYDHSAVDCFKQKCLAHLLKDVKHLEEDAPRELAQFPRKVKKVLQHALELGKAKAELAEEEFTQRLARIERRLDTLISAERDHIDPEHERFAKRLRKQREHLFSFLICEGIEATNNRAERELRPAVVTRKRGGCNKTQAGAKAHEVNTSLLVTARKNGRSPVDYITELLLTPPGTPLPLPTRATARASPREMA